VAEATIMPSCPTWLREYAAFHRDHRHDPNALMIVYTCTNRMQPGGFGIPGALRAKGRHSSICFGLGDRFQHIGFMLRFAAQHGRVLLIDWQAPEPLEQYLEPSTDEFDWRPQKMERLSNRTAVQRWMAHNWQLGFRRYSHEWASQRWLRITGNVLASAKLNSSALGDSDSFAAPFSCLWRALFKPSRALVGQLAAARQELRVDSSTFHALHLRMGDTANGSAFAAGSTPRDRPWRRFVNHSEALSILRCALRDSSRTPHDALSPPTLAKGSPLVLATDNAALKHVVLRWRQGQSAAPRDVLGHGRLRALPFDKMVNPVWRQFWPTHPPA